jgi:quercetin dioxygenase-like cupin family protein
MKITRLDQCQSQTVQMDGVQGAVKQVPLGVADGVPNFSVRVFTLEPGGGEIMSDEGPRPIGAGDYVFVSPGERHQYRNTGTGPLQFLCMVPKEYE